MPGVGVGVTVRVTVGANSAFAIEVLSRDQTEHIVDLRSGSGVVIVVWWRYSGVTGVLQWCYSGVTVVLQWRYLPPEPGFRRQESIRLPQHQNTAQS